MPPTICKDLPAKLNQNSPLSVTDKGEIWFKFVGQAGTGKRGGGVYFSQASPGNMQTLRRPAQRPQASVKPRMVEDTHAFWRLTLSDHRLFVLKNSSGDVTRANASQRREVGG